MSRVEFEEAVRKCDAALAAAPRDAAMLRRRGEAKRKLGRLGEALADFDAALAVQPAFALALAGRGAARRALGRLPEAIRDFDAALCAEPRNVLFLLDRGAARQALGRSEEAVADADSALELRPDYVPALQFRGEVRRKMGRHREAIADFNAALRLDSRQVQALAGRGAALRALGLRAEALADYDAALAIVPRSPSILAGRGAACLELRMAEAAKADFEASLALDPRSDFARWGRESALLQLRSAGLELGLAGFKAEGLNVPFVERRRPGFAVNGHATFWSADGRLFLYWCEQESRWKGSLWSHFPKVQRGGSSGVLAAPVHADIRSASTGGWHEFDGGRWVCRRSAGVARAVHLEVNLQTVTLGGFARAELNTTFTERFRPRFLVNGRETYWSADGASFLYWSSAESRWKGTLGGDLERVQGGASPGFVGAPDGVDLASADLPKAWHEWDGAAWRLRERGGVSAIGTLARAPASDAPPAKLRRTAQKLPEVPVLPELAEEWT